MKTKRLAGALASALMTLGVCSTASAAMPVTNVNDSWMSSLNQAMHSEDIAKFAMMIQQAQAQVQQLQSQYTAITGNRAQLGQIFNDPTLAQFVPNQFQSLYNGIRNGSLPSITSALSTVTKDQNTGTYSDMMADIWQRQQQAAGVNTGLAQQAYQANIQRMQDLQSLLGQINLAQDPAAKADLANRLIAEHAMIQNEQAKLELVAMMQKAEQQAQDAKARQAWSNMMTAPDELPHLPDTLTAQQ